MPVTSSSVDVVALRKRVEAALGLGITAAQDWCAEAVCSQRRAWQQWERGERAIHPGIYKLACIEVERMEPQMFTHIPKTEDSMTDWWRQRIDVFKQQSNLTDVGVAKRLDISPAMLSHVRDGRRALPIHARLRLLHALDYVITREILLRVMPEEIRAAMIDTNAAITDDHYQSNKIGTNDQLELPPVSR